MPLPLQVKSRPISLATKIDRKIGVLTGLLPPQIKWLRKILDQFKENAVEHKYPDAKLSAQLFQALCIKDIDQFAKQYNLDKNKLIRYHYSK